MYLLELESEQLLWHSMHLPNFLMEDFSLRRGGFVSCKDVLGISVEMEFSYFTDVPGFSAVNA